MSVPVPPGGWRHMTFLPPGVVGVVRSTNTGPAGPAEWACRQRQASAAARRRRAVRPGTNAEPEADLDADPDAEDALDFLSRRARHPLFAPEKYGAGLSVSQAELLFAVAGVERGHVFVTGRAGCGKSRAVHALLEAMTAEGVNFGVTASSGIAADPFDGVTLHSFLCLNEDLSLAECIARAKKFRGAELSRLEVLVIDEISMTSAETLSRAVMILRAVRGSLPVMVMVGDFAQLLPVRGSLLLKSEIWRQLKPRVIMLQESFRQQDDPEFVRLLDEARRGSLSATSVGILESRIGVAVGENGIVPTVLTPLRRQAEDINSEQLAKLDTERRAYVGRVFLGTRDAVDKPWVVDDGCTDVPPTIRGAKGKPKVPLATPALQGVHVRLPRDVAAWKAAEELVRNSAMRPHLELAVGAQVVFTANVHPPNIVNGSRGVVVGFSSNTPLVRVKNGDVVEVQPFARAKRRARGKPMPCFVFEQLPLALAFALTVHKAQGMTLQYVQLDLGKDVFAKGQAYVALSRARRLEDIALTRFDRAAIKADDYIAAWYDVRMQAAAKRAARADDHRDAEEEEEEEEEEEVGDGDGDVEDSFDALEREEYDA